VFWLQSIEEGSLAFLLADPFPLVPEYDAELPVAAEGHDVAALAIVTLPRESREPATMNLQAPLCLDLTTREGAQVLQSGDRWSVRHPIAIGDLMGDRAQVAGPSAR
jgi:flagellar assembly factor FliW